MMTDTLLSQSRTFLFGSNTTSQNRCDLKSKVGRCSGADLGFWDSFASVLDITLRHKTKVTIALRGGREFFWLPEALRPCSKTVLCPSTMAFANTKKAAATLTLLSPSRRPASKSRHGGSRGSCRSGGSSAASSPSRWTMRPRGVSSSPSPRWQPRPLPCATIRRA